MNPLLQSAREVMSKNFPLDIALGNIPGLRSANKFGRAKNADNGIATDVWNRANVADNQPIWLPPTASRIHTITSDSALDIVGGSGTSSVIVSYLPDWDTVEATEIVTGNLNAGIAMVNAGAIIHRIKSIPQATSVTPNVGTITATAAVDSTVTAQIEPNAGQTQMAIYGIPSTQTVYIGRLYANLIAAVGGNEISATLLFNPNPNLQMLAYLTKHTFGIRGGGTSGLSINYTALKTFPGPGIIKVQIMSDADNMDVSAGFDFVIRDN